MAAVGSYTKVAVFSILTLYFMSNWQFILGGIYIWLSLYLFDKSM